MAEARAVSNRLLGIGLGAGAALAAAFWLAEPIIPGIFSSDAGAGLGVAVSWVWRGTAGCMGVTAEEPVPAWLLNIHSSATVLPPSCGRSAEATLTHSSSPLPPFPAFPSLQRWGMRCGPSCPLRWPCCRSMRRCTCLTASSLAQLTSSSWQARGGHYINLLFGLGLPPAVYAAPLLGFVQRSRERLEAPRLRGSAVARLPPGCHLPTSSVLIRHSRICATAYPARLPILRPPAGAMVVAAGTAVALLLGVEPLGLGLPGVW